MNIEALYHKNYGVYAYPTGIDKLSLRLRTGKGDFSRCVVHYVDRYNYGEKMKSCTMELFAGDSLYDYYKVEIQDDSKRFKYFFEMRESDGKLWYYLDNRITDKTPGNILNSGFFQFPYINEDDLSDIPEWVQEAIIYQIFPERFFNGDISNDPQNIQKWGTIPESNSFYGGDLKGIREKLGYLKDLGVNAIYLTPVFLSPTNHKYDTVDYYRIDPQFGEIKDMKELVNEAHRRGIRVILDAVFNHCSHENPIFQDVVKRGEMSEYADWFYIKDFPVEYEPIPNYETFGVNLHNMPRFNTSNPDVQEYLIQIAEYWTKELNIDGWRLDVADEVSHVLWKKFRQRLKAINPDIFIIGEVWYYATPWLLGDEFDSIMNYPFRQAILDFIVDEKIDEEEFGLQLDKNLVQYKDHTNYALLNLLGSHDTARFLTLCDDNIKKMKLAVAFSMTFIGIPMIYYGDEVGIKGGEDPDCRRTMVWDENEIDRELLSFYKNMISIRKENPVLEHGEYRQVKLTRNSKVFAFIREDKHEKALIILNNDTKDVEITIDLKENGLKIRGFYDELSDENYLPDEDGLVKIVVSDMNAAVLVQNS